MNRRTFIISTSVAAALGFGGISFQLLKTQPNNLFNSLSELSHPDFKSNALKISPSKALAQLLKKKIILKNGAIDLNRLQKLSKDDALVTINNQLYSESEAQLYSLGYLAKHQQTLLLNNVDLFAGDMHREKTESAEACLALCEETRGCNGFTYAKPSHPNPEKHNQCFLKDKPVKFKPAKHYSSGIK